MIRKLLLVLAAPLAVLAAPSAAGAAQASATSSNWAGYVAAKLGVNFRHVSANWVIPAVTCSPGRRRYSANWVGLGGYRRSSTALEQIGTEADCTSTGRAEYAAWFELVPAAPRAVRLTVRPGDRISASVGVVGHVVQLRLANVTRGTVFFTRLRAPKVSTSSAEWIVEAPSACTSSSLSSVACRTLPLANFGRTSFAKARATSASGHTGTIGDFAWSSVAISLAADEQVFARMDGSAVGTARPGALATTGDAFEVDYAEAIAPVQSAPAGPPSPAS
jgi:hypothetical protein